SLKSYLELYTSDIRDFKRALDSLQKASSSLQKFEHEAVNGAIPTFIANHFKGPQFQFSKAVTDNAHAQLVDSKKTLDDALTTAALAATAHYRKCHAKHVELCKERADIDQCTQALLDKLGVYSTKIIQSSGRSNLKIWESYAQLVVTAFSQELEQAMFEYTARLANAVADKEAKASTVATAREDAEMKDGTKPIGTLIREIARAEAKAAIEAETTGKNKPQ
ncbi:hypothetical protein MPER_07578, partial [Moniliophthora perniciosa FA553]